MNAMIVLSFVLGYPIFIGMAYLLYKLLLTPLDKVTADQKREKAMLLVRARRTKMRKAKTRPVSRPETSPVFGFSDLNTSPS